MRSAFLIVASFWVLASLLLGGCSTAPRDEDHEDFMARATMATIGFENSVNGLDEQIVSSAGYIIFPDVTRWGIVISGGTYGRGAVLRPDGEQVGWAALNTGSMGLQAGLKGFRILMVLQDEATFQKFMKNQLTGSITGSVVVGEAGGSGTSRFQNGVAVYERSSTGLMAGINIGLNHLRYKPLESE